MRSFIPTDELNTRRRDGMNVSRGWRVRPAENYIITGVAMFFSEGYNGHP
jgi:hypothetical protein